MERRLLLGALILGAAVLTAWVGVRLTSREPPTPVQRPVSWAARPEALVGTEPLAVPALEERSPVEAGDAFAVPPREGVAVTVVARSTGRPVAGAEVVFVEDPELSDRELDHLRLDGRDMLDISRGFGAGYRADEEGRVTVPFPIRDATLLGAGERLFGDVRLAAGARGPADLELDGDRTLDVRVVGPDGAPAGGAWIVLEESSRRGDPDPFFLRRTDAETGVATIRLFANLREPLFVRAIVPGLEAESVLVPSRLPLREPLTLSIPATGSVEVRLVDRDGAPLTRPESMVYLAAAGASWSDGPFQAAAIAQETRRGRAVFPYVVPGTRLTAVVQFEARFAPRRKSFEGPAAAGELEVLELENERRQPTLEARLSLPDGRPLASARVDVCFDDGGSTLAVESTRTRGDGSLEIHSRAAQHVQFLVRPSAFSPQLGALVDVRERDLSADVDLSTVTLGPPPVLVAGRVVDVAGAPVVGAVVYTQRRETERKLGGSVTSNADRFHTRPDDVGRFELRGFARGKLRIFVEHPFLLPEGILVCRPGARDVVLRLRDPR